MLELIKNYAWLLGDIALLAWAVFELLSLRERPGRTPPGDGDRRKPPP